MEEFETFVFIISKIHFLIQKIKNDEMKKYGLHGLDAVFLFALYHHHPDGLTSKELTQICNVDKAAVSRGLKELSNKGMIIREKNDQKVYRLKYTLTEDGMQIAKRVYEKIQSAMDLAGENMDNPDAFNAYLQIMYENLVAFIGDTKNEMG